MQNASRITKNNSQGIIFVIISCQRVAILEILEILNSLHARGIVKTSGFTRGVCKNR